VPPIFEKNCPSTLLRQLIIKYHSCGKLARKSGELVCCFLCLLNLRECGVYWSDAKWCASMEVEKKVKKVLTELETDGIVNRG